MRMMDASGRRSATIAKIIRAALAAVALLATGAATRQTAARTISAMSGLPFPALAAADAAALIQTAQRQFNAGNYSGAITTLQSAVTQNSSSAEAYYWLGRTYYEIRDYGNAITAGEKSIALDPKNSTYHQWLGAIYGGKADREKSFSYARKVKKEFELAVRLNPSNVEARRDLEQYDMEAPWVVGGSKDEAREQVTAIEAIDPVEGHLAHGAYELN